MFACVEYTLAASRDSGWSATRSLASANRLLRPLVEASAVQVPVQLGQRACLSTSPHPRPSSPRSPRSITSIALRPGRLRGSTHARVSRGTPRVPRQVDPLRSGALERTAPQPRGTHRPTAPVLLLQVRSAARHPRRLQRRRGVPAERGRAPRTADLRAPRELGDGAPSRRVGLKDSSTASRASSCRNARPPSRGHRGRRPRCTRRGCSAAAPHTCPSVQASSLGGATETASATDMAWSLSRAVRASTALRTVSGMASPPRPALRERRTGCPTSAGRALRSRGRSPLPGGQRLRRSEARCARSRRLRSRRAHRAPPAADERDRARRHGRSRGREPEFLRFRRPSKRMTSRLASSAQCTSSSTSTVEPEVSSSRTFSKTSLGLEFAEEKVPQPLARSGREIGERTQRSRREERIAASDEHAARA